MLFRSKLAKDVGAKVIAGGCFFGNVGHDVVKTELVDVAVHGEGEVTIVELIQALRNGGQPNDLREVKGIVFRDGEETVFTGNREPLADLDRLPLPAYDLLPVERYGQESRNHHALSAIELSRGCSSACEFCVLWKQMGNFASGRARPYVRSKSPERLLEEIRILADR